MTFTETQQFVTGMAVEDWLDRYFREQGWTIEHTTSHEERKLHRGDRIFTRNGDRYYVEYKSGLQTANTGNIFLETISVDMADVPGWVYTSQADYLMYACLLNSVILIFVPSVLREKIAELKRLFREVPTSNRQNNGYNTWGLIIPLDYAIEHIAGKVLRL